MELFASSFWLWVIPIAFILVVLYIFRPKGKKGYDKDAQIPFADDDSRRD